MNTNFRIPLITLACCVGAQLAPWVAGSPLADSAVGVGTVLGNTLSSSAWASRPLDPETLVAKHTPTGQLFQLPFAVPSMDDLAKSASGWEYSGQLEFGVIGGDA